MRFVLLLLGACIFYSWRLYNQSLILYDSTLSSAPAPATTTKALYTHSSPDLDSVIPGESPDKLFHVIHITDLHVSRFHQQGGLVHLVYFLKRILPLIRPSFVVITGDLTDAKDESQVHGVQFKEEWEAYQSALKEAGVLDIPNYWRDLRGNHDCFSVPSWFHTDNYFRNYSGISSAAASAVDQKVTGGSAAGVNVTGGSWEIIDEYDFGRYKWIGLDGCPSQGTSRHYNFFASIDSEKMSLLGNYLADSPQMNHTFLLMHYPTATSKFGMVMDKSWSFSDLLYHFPVSLQLCGHLHRLAWGLGEKLEVYHERESFLELELADLKLTQQYRIITVDHDLVNVKNLRFNLPGILPKDAFSTNSSLKKEDRWWDKPEPPVVMITNPKHHRYLLPEREPWWRIQRSSHIRVLIFLPPAMSIAEVKTRVLIDGQVGPPLKYTGNDKLPLWTCTWSGQANRVIVQVLDPNDEQRVLSSDESIVSSKRGAVGEGPGGWIMSINMELLAKGMFLTIYAIWMLLLLSLVPFNNCLKERMKQFKQNQPTWHQLYFAYLLLLPTCPWFLGDVFYGRHDRLSLVYLYGVYTPGLGWTPLVDTWMVAAVDLLFWRFPLFLYIVFSSSSLSLTNSATTATKKNGFGIVQAWLVVWQLIAWFLAWRMIKWFGLGYVLLGPLTWWWLLIETWMVIKSTKGGGGGGNNTKLNKQN